MPDLIADPNTADPKLKILADLLQELEGLSRDVSLQTSRRIEAYLERFPSGLTPDALNLAEYLAMRSHDLRKLQTRLADVGLSSLGRGEAHVRYTLQQVINLLRRALEMPLLQQEKRPHNLLEKRAKRIFGKRHKGRHTRIMVTLPSEAAHNPTLIEQLMKHGMDCARINCAHDDAVAWEAMIQHIRRAEAAMGQRCYVMMDLAGHKIRTRLLTEVLAVCHLKPQRDDFGFMLEPAEVTLVDRKDRQPHMEKNCLPIATALMNNIKPGDRLYFTDCRGKKRHLHIIRRSEQGHWLAQCSRSSFITPGTKLTHDTPAGVEHYQVESFPGKEKGPRVFIGDELLLVSDPDITLTKTGKSGPLPLGCTYPGITNHLEPGERVWIDDGKIGCQVERISEKGVYLRVTHAGPKGVVLRGDKGLNFPESELKLAPLSEKDLQDLAFIVQHADMVALSFVQTLGDVDQLLKQLQQLDAQQMPVVVKIETQQAVKQLPDILLGTMGHHAMAVMIARGDLAVELGSVRMSEIQEEILWLCEAAHIPVIWATQVLETLAKNGTVSRPEITDAAMSVRAESVMMNKGPYITEAVEVLDNILHKMDAHQYKKVSRLRKLHW